MENDYFTDLKAERESVSISSVDSEPIKPVVKMTESEKECECTNDNFKMSNDQLDSEYDNSDTEEKVEVKKNYTENVCKLQNYFSDAGIQITNMNNCTEQKESERCVEHLQSETHLRHEQHSDLAQIPLELVSEAVNAKIIKICLEKHIIVAESLGTDCIAFDIGTKFCLDDGHVVGICVAIIGPVTKPYYIITTPPAENIIKLIKENNLHIGTTLHCDIISQKVIHDIEGQCNSVKGTDASYIDDVELPEEVEPDFSDDEEEYRWKKAKLEKRNIIELSITNDPIDCHSESFSDLNHLTEQQIKETECDNANLNSTCCWENTSILWGHNINKDNGKELNECGNLRIDSESKQEIDQVKSN